MPPNTTTETPASLPSDEILGLPVSTFAYILVGAGIAAGLLFLGVFAAMYKYRKFRRLRRNKLEKTGSKFEHVRDVWQQDTRARLENLRLAGIPNEAFQNIDEYQLYSIEEYRDRDHTGDKYKKLYDDSAKSSHASNAAGKVENGGSVKGLQNGDSLKMNGTERRVTFNSVPVVQINGTRVDNIDNEISNFTNMVCQNPVKKPDDYFVNHNASGKHSNVLVSSKAQQQIIVTDDKLGDTKERS